jgi:tRNA(Ile2) C34 agmatinyltransferase TiaS
MFQDWFAEEVDEFDSKNETPMCVACYNDLAFDGFNNYHCSSCNTWYSEEDILRKF